MSETILQQLKHTLSPLIDARGFQIVEEHYNPNAFGNAVLRLRSTDFAVRVVRDRGAIFVDIGPAQNIDEWHDLKIVLEFLGHGSTDTSAFDPDQVATTLNANYESLKNFFSKENYPTVSNQLEEFERKKTKERLPGLNLPNP